MSEFRHLHVGGDSAVRMVLLNRPEIHNAFHAELISELTTAFRELGADRTVRAIVLGGAGKTFSAGADVNWMRAALNYTLDENLRDARAMAEMFDTIRRCPKPVIARVQGAALGGGAGLVAAADITVAAENAVFSFSEVRLGIIPAVISPHVLRRIGERGAREYFLTGARFDARRAAEIGLVAHVSSEADLDKTVDRITGEIVQSGPEAVAAAKALIFDVGIETDRAKIIDLTSRRIAERRTSPEGQEGLRAFLEKRTPPWAPAKK